MEKIFIKVCTLVGAFTIGWILGTGLAHIILKIIN